MISEKISDFISRFLLENPKNIETSQNMINLNRITTYLITKIIYKTIETKKSYSNAVQPRNSIKRIIEKVYNDTIEFNSISEFNQFYSVKYLSKLVKFNYLDILRGMSTYGTPYYEVVQRISNCISTQEKRILEDLFSDDSSIYTGYYCNNHSLTWGQNLAVRINSFENSNLLVVLISATFCICKILYINNKINRINSDSEVYKIVKNMLENINDKETIINKFKPLHDEFYKEQFGNLNDDNLYVIALNILIEKVKSETNNLEKINKEAKIIDTKILDNITKTIELKAKEEEKVNIIEEMINTMCIESDLCGLKDYMEVICTIPILENKYNCMYDSNKNERDKNRYLTGNFDLEKKEEEEKYRLDNIESGVEFEEYLCELFRKLEYDVKHNGKAGDQGADLILKKNNITYVVQAKFYSSKLDNTPVQEVVGAIKYYEADYGVVITNSYFTTGALNLAKSNNIILIDGDRLNDIVNSMYLYEHHKKDILQQYF